MKRVFVPTCGRCSLFLSLSAPLVMAKKVDVSFMKQVSTDGEWNKEVKDGGAKVLCSAPSPREHGKHTTSRLTPSASCQGRRIKTQR